MRIKIEDYSSASFVVRGDTFPYRDVMKSMGGKWNKFLRGGAGWIFSSQKKPRVSAWVATLEQSGGGEAATTAATTTAAAASVEDTKANVPEMKGGGDEDEKKGKEGDKGLEVGEEKVSPGAGGKKRRAAVAGGRAGKKGKGAVKRASDGRVLRSWESEDEDGDITIDTMACHYARVSGKYRAERRANPRSDDSGSDDYGGYF